MVVFVIGAYVGLTLLAALIVSSDEPEQTDAPQLADDPRMALIAAEWRSENPTERPNRERTGGKRSATPRRKPEELENQADFQW